MNMEGDRHKTGRFVPLAYLGVPFAYPGVPTWFTLDSSVDGPLVDPHVTSLSRGLLGLMQGDRSDYCAVSTRERAAVFGETEVRLEASHDHDVLTLRTIERGELIENRIRVHARVRDETKAHLD